MKKLKTIHLRHENERSTIPPYFWKVSVEKNGKETDVDPGSVRPHPNSNWTTKEHAEDLVVGLGEALGIKDTTSAEEWAAKGFQIEMHGPAPGTFSNWPE